MEALLDEHLAAWERGDTDRVFACDSEFHATLLAYTRNRRIVSLIGGLADQTAIYRVRRMASQTRLRKSIEEHRMILEAARNRDAERIQDLMTNHLLGFCREALHEWLGGGLF
jgi:DNA-binding GntR family transcriptional regulator